MDQRMLEEMDVSKYIRGFSTVTVQKDDDIDARHDHYVRMLVIQHLAKTRIRKVPREYLHLLPHE